MERKENSIADGESGAAFDFAEHERRAIAEYLPHREFYSDLADAVAKILRSCLEAKRIKVHSVEHRAKDASSFGRKAATPSEEDPNSPKYPEPLKQITDLSAVRIISYFPGTLEEIGRLISEEFDIVEQSDKAQELIEAERFGYRSIHYLVRLKAGRARLAEYERFAGAMTEIQVRTILQHAWAEIEHDIQYKSSTAIPTEIRRRFMALAGMLEIADREFQAIQDEDRKQVETASSRIRSGQLTDVEITPAALKQYLDQKLGPDDRISDWNYDWTTRLLKTLGFRDLDQVRKAIEPYDDNRLSSIVYGRRQGQLSRFELMIRAALGKHFIERHQWRGIKWFDDSEPEKLRKLEQGGIQVATYDPLADSAKPAATVARPAES